MGLRFFLTQIVENRLGHSRVELTRTKTITTTYYKRMLFERSYPQIKRFPDSGLHVGIHRFANGAWFFGPVKDSDLLDTARESFHEGFDREGTVQAHLDEPHLIGRPSGQLSRARLQPRFPLPLPRALLPGDQCSRTGDIGVRLFQRICPLLPVPGWARRDSTC